ncbi:hypothetical protein NPIL_100111 [Nephila pilipes]|uniref:Uncharacterized protein n=1 Tax=Nephila pilipes TaxID=299642 RepID=A0A8X6UQM1_NEPPI|nr:hypothetical protein NPIL_100111 [Nephila pilipes]
MLASTIRSCVSAFLARACHARGRALKLVFRSARAMFKRMLSHGFLLRLHHTSAFLRLCLMALYVWINAIFDIMNHLLFADALAQLLRRCEMVNTTACTDSESEPRSLVKDMHFEELPFDKSNMNAYSIHQ